MYLEFATARYSAMALEFWQRLKGKQGSGKASWWRKGRALGLELL